MGCDAAVDDGCCYTTPVKKGAVSKIKDGFSKAVGNDNESPAKSACSQASRTLMLSGGAEHRIQARGGSSYRKPKKPLSAYIFFSQEQRDKLKR